MLVLQYLGAVIQWLLRVWLRTNSVSNLGPGWKCRFLDPTLGLLNQNFWGWSPAVYVLTTWT